MRYGTVTAFPSGFQEVFRESNVGYGLRWSVKDFLSKKTRIGAGNWWTLMSQIIFNFKSNQGVVVWMVSCCENDWGTPRCERQLEQGRLERERQLA